MEAVKPSRIRIVVDHRESKNHVLEHLRSMAADIVPEHLRTGDYICSDRVAVERKTASDFIQSIIDRRIFRQISEMGQCFEAPLMIIEGDPFEQLQERNMHPNALRGALASIALDYKMPLIWTKDARETAGQIYWIACREQIKRPGNHAIRCSFKPASLRDQQEFLVAGLPNVNSKLSRRLLEKFKTPKRVFSAKPDRLMKVEGIGKLKAEKIWKLLNSDKE